MTQNGILSFDLYNLNGINELFVNTPEEAYQQTLKLIIRNISSTEKIVIKKEGGYNFALKFKQKVLPNGYVPSIKVSEWRSIKGEDIFNGAKLTNPAFNQGVLEEEFVLNTNPIIKAIENALEKPFKFDAAEDTPAQQDLKENTGSPFERWKCFFQKARDEYKECLAEIERLGGRNSTIANNPLMLELLGKLSNVFTRLNLLQKKEEDLLTEIEKFKAKEKKLKENLEGDLKDKIAGNVVTQFQEYLKTNIPANKLFKKSLWKLKINEILNLDEVQFSENVLKILKRDLTIKATKNDDNWNINYEEKEQEQGWTFAYLGKDSTDIVIPPNGYLLIDLVIQKSLIGYSRGINVALEYPETKANQQKNTPPVSQCILNLVNYSRTGLPAPVEALLSKGTEVLNNSVYPNSTTLLLKNNSTQLLDLPKGSQIRLSFKVQNEGTTEAYALMEKDKVQALKVSCKFPISVSKSIFGDELTPLYLGEYAREALQPIYNTGETFVSRYDQTIGLYNSMEKKKKAGEMTYTYTNLWFLVPVMNEQSLIGFKTYYFKTVTTDRKDVIHEEALEGHFKYETQISIKENLNKLDDFIWTTTGIIIDLEAVRSTQKIDASFTFDIKMDYQIPVHANIELSLSDLVTGVEPGPANINIDLTRLKDYRDTQLKATVQKVTYLSDATHRIHNIGNNLDQLNIDYPTIELRSPTTAVAADAPPEYFVRLDNNGFQVKTGKYVINLKGSDGFQVQTDQYSIKLDTNKGFQVKAGQYDLSLDTKDGFQVKAGQYDLSLDTKDGFQVKAGQYDLSLDTKDGFQVKTGQYDLSLEKSGGFQVKKGENTLFEVNDQSNILSFAPVDTVLMWHGTVETIPKGWAVCDGTNDTPDLRNQFVVGVGSDYKLGESGGFNEIKLDEQEMPSHTHDVKGYTKFDGEHIHYWKGEYNAKVTKVTKVTEKKKANIKSLTYNNVFEPYPVNMKDGEHRHYIDISSGSKGGSKAHENRPPYYALYYIMRIKE